MLQEVQLLVAGGEGEVITGGTLTAFLGTKGRVGQNHIEILHGCAHAGQGIAQLDFAVNVMEHGVHQSQTVGIMDKLTAGKGFISLKLCHFRIQIKEVIGGFLHMAMGSDHKSKGTAVYLRTPCRSLRSRRWS